MHDKWTEISSEAYDHATFMMPPPASEPPRATSPPTVPARAGAAELTEPQHGAAVASPLTETGADSYLPQPVRPPRPAAVATRYRSASAPPCDTRPKVSSINRTA